MTNPATAARTMSQVNEASFAAHMAMENRANVRRATNSLKNIAKGKLLPNRAIGMAPITWASVIASIMAAPPLVSPVRLKATSENATGPAACGTPKVPDEMNQRSSGKTGPSTTLPFGPCVRARPVRHPWRQRDRL